MSVVSRAQILTLFGAFCGDVLTVDEANGIDRLLDEVILMLGQDARAWMSQVTTTDSGTVLDAADDDRYELRASLGLIHLLALFVDDRQLARETEHTMPPHYRDAVGDPIVYLTESRSDRYVRLYPRPLRVVTGRTIDDLHGAPTVIYTEQRSSRIPAILALPIVLLLCAREFERESAHRDQDFSSICTALAENMLGKIV